MRWFGLWLLIGVFFAVKIVVYGANKEDAGRSETDDDVVFLGGMLILAVVLGPFGYYAYSMAKRRLEAI